MLQLNLLTLGISLAYYEGLRLGVMLLAELAERENMSITKNIRYKNRI